MIEMPACASAGSDVFGPAAEEDSERLRTASAIRAATRATGGPGARGRRRPRGSSRADRPGRKVHAETSRTRRAGATRLRRRLSRIFQRLIIGQRIGLHAGSRPHAREDPTRDLPVAPNPSLLSLRVSEHRRRVVVDDFEVRDERAAGEEALEEVVREKRVLRNAPCERTGERVDVVEALAGVAAFREEVLIGVRDGGRVRVDAGVAGVHPREDRPGRARHRDADARLEDRVALGDATRARVVHADDGAGGARSPMSSFAVSRGSRVSLSSVMQYRIPGRMERSPRVTLKVVSAAPRRSRLNSSILPRLRSQPIQRSSDAFHFRRRWKR